MKTLQHSNMINLYCLSAVAQLQSYEPQPNVAAPDRASPACMAHMYTLLETMCAVTGSKYTVLRIVLPGPFRCGYMGWVYNEYCSGQFTSHPWSKSVAEAGRFAP